MTAPWLSVLMPTYNGAAYLSAALDSVVAEDDPGVECIAVDDGSTDDTLAVLERYRDRLNLTIRSQARVGNWVTNSNIALADAAGRFSCLLHQDDIWLPGRLRRIKDAIAEYPSVGLFLHPAYFIDAQSRRLGPWRCPLAKAPTVLEAGAILPRLLVQNFIAIPSPVFRTDSARQIGGLDEALWYGADWDFWLKLSTAGRTVCLAEPLACFRVHGEAQTARRSIDIDDFRRQHESVLERHLKILADDSVRRSVRRSAELSIVVNATLASRFHQRRPEIAPLFTALCRAGLFGIWRYVWVSRIWERVNARLKARRRARWSAPDAGADVLAR